MLVMNSFYARQQLGKANGTPHKFIDDDEIRDYHITEQGRRYELLQRALLRDFGDIDKLLDQIVNHDHNMTLSEVKEWPALSKLVHSSQYKAWEKKQIKFEARRRSA